MSRREALRHHPQVPILLVSILLSGAAAAQIGAPRDLERESILDRQYILQAPSQEATEIMDRYQLRLVEEISAGGRSFRLVEAPYSILPQQLTSLVKTEARAGSFEQVQVASLPEIEDGAQLEPSASSITEDLLQSGSVFTRCLAGGFGRGTWSGYANQHPTELIRLRAGHRRARRCGEKSIVAIIDTGVDPEHPLLSRALVSGYDFLHMESGAGSDWGSLDRQQRAAMREALEEAADRSTDEVMRGRGTAVPLNQSTVTLIEQSTVTLIEGQDLPLAFGHGTMVAGIIRLTAPKAKIMSLRAFDGNGQAHIFDVIKAILFAVDNGADIINMSFSTETYSESLAEAIRYAEERGVVCVAAVGNRGAPEVVYPAAHAVVAGVASTSREDTLSLFSNYGQHLVLLGAPGEGIITTYPGGLFAAGWGTSFATPFVSGTVALLLAQHNDGDDDDDDGGSSQGSIDQALRSLRQGAEPLYGYGSDLGAGRLDVFATVADVEEDDD